MRPKFTEMSHGYIRIDNVRGCLSVGEDEVAVTGGVILPPTGQAYDVWIDVLRHDVKASEDGPVWTRDLTVEDEDRAHDALVEAARELAREYYA